MRLHYLIPVALLAVALFTGCKKESTTTTPETPIQFTFFNPGGNCGGRVQNGSFFVGRPLTSSKTISVSVNVNAVGPYTIVTDTVNGITFSRRDTFHATGAQTVVLQGSGTPVTAGTNNYTLISSSGDTCVTYAKVIASVSAATFNCKINGVFNDFSRGFSGSLDYAPGADMKISGGLADGSNNFFDVWIQHPSLNPLTTGTYSVNTAGLFVKGKYTDPSLNTWLGQTESAAQTNPFIVAVSSVSASQVTGTFSGTIKENAGAGPAFKTITEGNFSFVF